MPIEIWKNIPRFGGSHQASTLGRIRSVDRVVQTSKGKMHVAGRLMKQHMQANGYAAVTISKGGKYRPYHVHVLVLETFVGPRPAGAVCRHLDGDRLNNPDSNLAWGTATENQADRWVHGTRTACEKHPMAKLTRDQVVRIKRLWLCGKERRELSEMFGVSAYTITDITGGRTWKGIA